jgi:cellobiose phosphorylase
VSGAPGALAGRRPGWSPAPAGVLGHADYTALVTAAGTGFSAAAGRCLTRWAADPVEGRDGWLHYLRDVERGTVWSAGTRPAARAPERYATDWEPGRFALARLDDGIETALEVCVAPDAPVEIRRLVLRNLGAEARLIEVTSYAEVVLHHRAADAGHPAFAKLFVQTEYVAEPRALLARRRARGQDERHPWLWQTLLGDGPLEHETDRARFVGRGCSLSLPAALAAAAPLAGTVGNVLDPAFALRRRCRLPAGESVALTFLMGVAPDREAALAQVAAWAEPQRAEAAFPAAAERSRARMARLGLSAERARGLEALAAALLHGQGALRATPERLERCAGDLGRLEAYGVSAQRPFVLCCVEPAAATARVGELLAASRYWRDLGLELDVLVLCDDPAALAAGSPGGGAEGFHLRSAAELSEADLDGLAGAARCVLEGGLGEPVVGGGAVAMAAAEVPAAGAPAPPPAATPASATPASATPASATPREYRPVTPRPGEPLLFYNGHGGFASAGDEYVIRLPHTAEHGLARPPAPWINVLANEDFGTLVSETGAGYTWSRNSREHRLTPWSNDPVLDPHGEALYLRDEEAGGFWSPLPGPAPAAAAYEVRHGFGQTRCAHASHGLDQEVTVFVPRHDPVKVVRLRLTNKSGAARRLSAFAYQRLVLGVLPEESGRFVVTRHDAAAGLLTAVNRTAGEFAGGVAFAAAVRPAAGFRSPGDAPQLGAATAGFTCDRASFLGADGEVAAPTAVRDGTPLDGRAGAGLDPCFAQQVTIVLEPGATAECAFLLGEAGAEAEAAALVARYREPGALDAELEAVRRFWRDTLSGIRVETPALEIDLMVNGWLAYQNLACRIWARSAFYQSGGAFGFRDQLQDATALTVLRPDLAREQILLHAAHQFVEGDVLHWWHPPLSRGIRTRFADDLLWLPYLTAYYVATSGDWPVLDERVRFLAARPLAPGEDEAYLVPTDSGTAADLYEHCCRALDRSLATGAHGLPLFGSGDWNDGMNRVGREGKGESVWMGFFLYAVLGDFAAAVARRGDGERQRRYAAARDALREALERAGWDGEWYRRAYYDDGTPLGSRTGDECQIDALAQAWAVISGAVPPERARQAMDAAERRLVAEREGLIRLLTPAFEKTPHDPGYIKGYVPGVRENGGQYTHGALWVVRAEAELGRRDRAARLLEMLSPVSHARTAADAALYKVEPYVVAADVYGEPPHVGRGGWTWYTGSAGWMYRVALESVLGFRLQGGDTLVLRPCLPDRWGEVRIKYRVPGEATRYDIRVRNREGRAERVVEAALDGASIPVEDGGARVPVSHDGRAHRVEIVLGSGRRG